MSRIGPLSTTFTPSASCASETRFTVFVGNDGTSYPAEGPIVTEGCYPPDYKPILGYYYSPAVCPSGYTQGCAQAAEPLYTTTTCCPSALGISYSCRPETDLSTVYMSEFACVAAVTGDVNPLSGMMLVSGGSTMPLDADATMSVSEIVAYGVVVKIADNEREPARDDYNDTLGLPLKTAFKGHPGHGLAPGRAASIAVGVTCGVLLLILGFVLLWAKKRSRREHRASRSSSQGTSIASPQSLREIRRKPVPLRAHPATDGASPGTPQSYVALSTSDTAEEPEKPFVTQKPSIADDVSVWKWEVSSLVVSISQLKWLWFSERARSLEDMELFDKASRGAWGSILMLYKQFTPRPKSLTASFGAILVLLALALDPFTQASVSIKQCRVQAGTLASIPQAHNYTQQAEWLEEGYAKNDLDNAMQLAISLGLLQPPKNTSSNIAVSCPTGDCEFAADDGATFASLGVCVAVADISGKITYKKNDTQLGYYLDGSANFLKPGAPINITNNPLPFKGTSDQASAPSKITGDSNENTLINIYINTMLATNLTDCRQPGDCGRLSHIKGIFKPAAFRLSLSLCVQTFSANFTNGTYQEHVLKEEGLRFVEVEKKGVWFNQPRDKFQLKSNKTLYGGRWRACPSTSSQTAHNTINVYSDELAQLPLDEQQKDNSPSLWQSPECVFEMSWHAANDIADHLSKKVFGPSSDETVSWPTWYFSLWDDGRINADSVRTFGQGLAMAMSAQIRKNPAGPKILRETLGDVFEVQPCIRVRWPWLSFPAALLTLEVIFFVSVTAANHRKQWVVNWKSSTLAIAFQNIGSPRAKDGTILQSDCEKDLRLAANALPVTLVNIGSRWQLRNEYRERGNS